MPTTVLEPCQSSVTQWNGPLMQLPDDLLFSIMSHMTIQEGARMSTFSHKWKKLWLYFPGIFNFEEPSSIVSLEPSFSYPENASRFVSWVNHVVEIHLGPKIQEFKLIFLLDDCFRSQIDKWVVFALEKQPKSIVIDLYPEKSNYILLRYQKYTLPLECCIPLSTKIKHGLKALNLRFVNLTTQVLDCFLNSCPFLDNLHLQFSEGLTSITSSSCILKHLHVHCCYDLEIIDILAPKLLTFYYNGLPIPLHIRNALLLSEVTVGGDFSEPIDYAFHPLAEYCSQLESLSVMAKLYKFVTIGLDLEMNMVIPPVSNLTRLKHLELSFHARRTQSILGWMTLVEACPVLEKITLKLGTCNMFNMSENTMGKRSSSPRPLKCLKTLEVRGFTGWHIDVEFVTYVLENAMVLKQLIIDFDGSLDLLNRDLSPSIAMPAVMELKRKLRRRRAELIIKEYEWHKKDE